MKPFETANVDTPLESVRPIGEFVLVEVLGEVNYIESGAVKPPGATYDPDRPGIRKGRVVAVGPGAKMDDGSRGEMAVVVGDTVLYPRVPSQSIRLNGREFCFLREHQHLLAVLDGLEEA